VAALGEECGNIMEQLHRCSFRFNIFPILAFILTLLVKERMNKRAQWAEEKLKESGLF
jgi:putative membrane protein